jgi:hypothetical protein
MRKYVVNGIFDLKLYYEEQINFLARNNHLSGVTIGKDYTEIRFRETETVIKYPMRLDV